jgi:hypothetical protein
VTAVFYTVAGGTGRHDPEVRRKFVTKTAVDGLLLLWRKSGACLNAPIRVLLGSNAIPRIAARTMPASASLVKSFPD